MIELNTLNEEASRLIQRISSVLTGPERPEILTYEDLDKVPELAGWQGAEGVKSRRIPVEGALYFETEFEAGARISTHYHDCTEIIWVDTGTVVDLVTGKAWTKGQKFLIKKGMPHRLSSPSGCKVYTQLIK